MGYLHHRLDVDDVFTVLDDIIETMGEKPEGLIYDLMCEMLGKIDSATLATALEDVVGLWNLDYEMSPNYDLSEDDPDYDPEIGDDFDYIESVTGVKAR